MSPSQNSACRVRVVSAALFLKNCRTRQPFRFGVHTLVTAPLALLRVEAEVDGRKAVGYASDLVVPKWFEKDKDKTPRDDVAALLASVERAMQDVLSRDPDTAFALWHGIWTSQRAANPNVPPLVTGFGTSLVERATLDAVCRALGISFFEALKSDRFGFRPEEIYAGTGAGTRAWSAATHLPAAPLESVRLRHTVGLLDPLVEGDLTAREPDDGCPRTLKATVERDELEHFKIKLCGDVDKDASRLLAIGGILKRAVRTDWKFTLDGNEQFARMQDLVDLLEMLASRPVGRELFSHLLYIEQPLPRGVTFDAASNQGIERLDRFGGVILDEADGEPEAFRRALDLGYRGVSMKNCKGVFRALAHRALIERTGRGFQSGEDLTNLPIVALQQDLATAAALHLGSIERNGHHYFRGLDHLDPQTRAAALREHPDLYEERDGGVFLRIHKGRLSLRSLACKGYGTAIEGLEEGFTPAPDWSPPADL